MRSEIIETVKNAAMKYVHSETGHPLQELMGDVVQSKHWQQVFGDPVSKEKTLKTVTF